MNASVLLVDDEVDFLESMSRVLRIRGYERLICCQNPLAAIRLLETEVFDIAVLDVIMPDLDGLVLMQQIMEQSPDTNCILLTACDDVETAVKAMRLGAFDYLIKPITPMRLLATIGNAEEYRRSKQSPAPMPTFADFGGIHLGVPEIIADDAELLRLRDNLATYAQADAPLLLTGETGVGKTLFARAIHAEGPRKDGPFLLVDMPGVAAKSFESEFFGAKVGNGAMLSQEEKPGHLAKAHGGTLFLKEIGDLSLEVQGKLLRMVHEGAYAQQGFLDSSQADVRFILSSNRDLLGLVRQGRFRKDLFYRVQAAHLHLPPLRDHLDDVESLASYFLATAGLTARLSPAALAALKVYSYPGNVRELKGVVLAAANLSAGQPIECQHLHLPAANMTRNMQSSADQDQRKLSEVEREHILAVFEDCKGNKVLTAKKLDIGLQTLYRKLKAYGL